MAKEFIGNLNSILEQDIALYCDARIAIIENLDNIEGIELAKIQQRNESECDMEKECCLLAI